MKTRRGICTNLWETDYSYCIGGLIFYFSSEFYLNKFKNNVRNYVETETLKVKNKYNLLINLDLYLTIVYYKKVEKRGFLIRDLLTYKEITENVIIGNQILKY